MSVYTEWYWKCDLHNIRTSSRFAWTRAQIEIQDYATAMCDLIEASFR